MPWDYILGSAGGAGIVLVFGILLARQLIERAVDSQFQVRLEQLRNELSRNLEFDKSDLAVWADLRKDILAEMWKAHRDIVKGMTTVILKAQTAKSKPALKELGTTLNEYRKTVHSNIDLMSPEAVGICQDFLDTAYAMAEGTQKANDGIPLKAIRRKFYKHTAEFYGLEKMMPWMATSAENETARTQQ